MSPRATAPAAAKKKVPTSPRNGRKRFELAAGSKGYVKLPPALAHFSWLLMPLFGLTWRRALLPSSPSPRTRTRIEVRVRQPSRAATRLSFSARAHSLTHSNHFLSPRDSQIHNPCTGTALTVSSYIVLPIYGRLSSSVVVVANSTERECVIQGISASATFLNDQLGSTEDRLASR